MDQETITKQIEEYLEKGGKITYLPYAVRSTDVKVEYNPPINSKGEELYKGGKK